MKNLFFYLLLLLSSQLVAQSDSLYLEELRSLLYAEKYEKVIEKTEDANPMNAKVKYIRARAFYYSDKEDEALQLFDEIIAGDSLSQGSRYFKSKIHLGREEYNIALSTMNDLLAFVEDDADYFALKGEIIANQGKYMEAIPLIEKALDMGECSEHNYLLLSDIYKAIGEYSRGMEVVEDACEKVREDSYYYEMIHFEAAMNCFRSDNFAGAKSILTKLYKTHPTPHTIEKLIQAHYALGEYKEGNAYKKDLYAAKEAGTLPEDLLGEFCFDQFALEEDKYIIVAERFDESASLYYKHVFYVLDDENKLIETVQTEWSFAVESSGKKYVLGGTIESDEGRRHNTYWDYTYNEDFDYAKLKKDVLDVLSGKGNNPSSSSSFKKPNGDLDVTVPVDTPVEDKKGKKKKKAKKKKKKD